MIDGGCRRANYECVNIMNDLLNSNHRHHDHRHHKLRDHHHRYHHRDDVMVLPWIHNQDAIANDPNYSSNRFAYAGTDEFL